MTPETRIVGVGAPSALHLSQQVIAAMQAGRSGAPRVSVATPLDEMVAALERVPAGGDRRVSEHHRGARRGATPGTSLDRAARRAHDVGGPHRRRRGEDRVGVDEAGPGVLLDRGRSDRSRLARPRRNARLRGGDRRGRRRGEPAGASGDARQQGAAHEPRQPHPAADPLRALGRGRARGGRGPERPAVRSDRADRRPERRGAPLPGRAARRRRGPPLPPSRAVRAAARGAPVPDRPSVGRASRSHRRPRLRAARAAGARRRAVERAVAAGGRAHPGSGRGRDAIAREAGHAAKAKLVVSEVAAA